MFSNSENKPLGVQKCLSRVKNHMVGASKNLMYIRTAYNCKLIMRTIRTPPAEKCSKQIALKRHGRLSCRVKGIVSGPGIEEQI